MKIDLIVYYPDNQKTEVFFEGFKILKLQEEIEKRLVYKPEIFTDFINLEAGKYYIVFNVSAQQLLETYGQDCSKIILADIDRATINNSGIYNNFLGVVDILQFYKENPLIVGHADKVAKLKVKEIQRYAFPDGKDLVLFHGGPDKSLAEQLIEYLK